MPAVMPIRGSKRISASADRTRASIEERLILPRPYHPPRRLDTKVDISVDWVNGWPESVGTDAWSMSVRGVALPESAV